MVGEARIGPTWDTRGLRTPRFRLKTTGHGGGHVDGAWWPHSDDLSEELPGLIAALSVGLGAVRCVMFNRTDWTEASAELRCGGRVIGLDARNGQPPNTIEVLCVQGNTIALLIVPFCIRPDRAHSIVVAASAPGNASDVDTLLMISGEERERLATRDAARQRWESQSGAQRAKGAAGPQRPASSYAPSKLRSNSRH